jgi:membrane-bound lytic murein transglycosylase B
MREMTRLIVATALIAMAMSASLAHTRTGHDRHVLRANSVSARQSQKTVVGTVPYAGRDDAMAFAEELAQKRLLDPQWVRHQIGQARFLPQLPQLMLPPGNPLTKNWQAYRQRFVEPVRIAAGVRFWREHQASLARAEAQYGVPAAYIVGILGIETLYGRQMGHFRVLDALATLSFDFPASHPRAAARQAYFRAELTSFLEQRYNAGTDPGQELGSYAGAMGMPQFMPSSWAQFAVDFDGDGRIDLHASADDAIGSVANYFKAHGWQAGLPTHYAVDIDHDHADLNALLLPDILPTFNAAAFEAKGALLDEAGRRHAGQLALVELQNGGAQPNYVAGTENFYVITRYNWSSYYAMAVIELGQAVQSAIKR